MWILVPVEKILNKFNQEGLTKDYAPGKSLTTNAKTA